MLTNGPTDKAVADLLARATAAGLCLGVNPDGRLRVNGAVTAQALPLVRELLRHEAGLLAARGRWGPPPRPPRPPAVPCAAADLPGRLANAIGEVADEHRSDLGRLFREVFTMSEERAPFEGPPGNVAGGLFAVAAAVDGLADAIRAARPSE